MHTTTKYKRYDKLEDLLTIPAEEIDKPIYFMNQKNPLPPIWFAIENNRRDIIGSLLKKQTPTNKINFTGPIKFAYGLGVEALKNKNLTAFINHLKALILIDSTNVTSKKLAEYLDRYLSNLSKEEFKLAIQNLLVATDNIAVIYQPVLKHSKYINYLTTGFNGNYAEATKAFNPDQLLVLNEAGFAHAKDQKNDKGDTLARCFIKQALQNKNVEKQHILFYQDLYVDNLECAAELINQKTGSQLYVHKGGACSAFIKYWLFHELGFADQQAKFFHEIMEIASLTRAEIRDRIENEFQEKKGEKVEFHESFLKLIKDHASNLDIVHRNYQFAGQITQRTMKKSFGLELIDEYDLNQLQQDKPIFAYLRVRYVGGGTGHAIGVHIERHELPSGQSVMQYKVWDPNDAPKTFNGLAEFTAYLNGLKSNPKYSDLSIIEFATHDEPATQAKMASIEAFRNSISHLNSPLHPMAAPIVSCLQLLLQHYDSGVVPMNQVIPLFVFLGTYLNNFGQHIDLTPLNMVVQQQHLMGPAQFDLNKLPFLHEFVDSALSHEPSLPHIVTALYALGLSEEQHYLRLSRKNQDQLLDLALIENRAVIVNRLLGLRFTEPNHFPVALALKEMMTHSENLQCKNILVNLLLNGKTFDAADFKLLDKQPKSSSLFTQALPPYRKLLRQMIMDKILNEVKTNAGKVLGKENDALLSMLDNALNPMHENNRGCYDLLTLRSYFTGNKVEPRQHIRNVLQAAHVTVGPDMQSKYPFVADYLKQLQSAPAMEH